MDLDSVADELYGTALEEFISTRNAREKQAKAAGDRELAASIHRLIKPSATAWLANQLVRKHRDDLEPLLELGAGLRAAMAALSGSELRTLGRQQHRLIAALVARAGALAAADGRRVSADTARGLEQTLHAALADASTAQTLMNGQLTEALLDSGFASDPGSARAARTAKPAEARPAGATGGRTSSTGTAATAGRDAAMRKERRAAQAALDAATDTHDLARTFADESEAALNDAVARIARLTDELDQAAADRTRLDREHHRLRADAVEAERAVAVAARRLEAAHGASDTG